jgi:hypothetical protein
MASAATSAAHEPFRPTASHSIHPLDRRTAMAPLAKPSLQEQFNQLKQHVNQQDVIIEQTRKVEMYLASFDHRVMAKAEKWLMTARNIGSAFTRAVKAHRDALANEDKIKQLRTQAFYSVLTVLSTGALAWVAQPGAVKKISELLGPILKDTLSAGLGEAFSANGPLLDPPEAMRDAVNQEPQEFQNDLENKVSAFKIKAHDYLAKVYDFYRTAPPETWLSAQVDKLQTMTDEWMQKAAPIGNLAITLADQEEKRISDMADEIERGFWREWILKLEHSVQISPFGDPDPIIQTEYDSISSGGPVAARLDYLGILREADVSIKWYHEAIEEDRPLIAWARNKYKPHPFTAE